MDTPSGETSVKAVLTLFNTGINTKKKHSNLLPLKEAIVKGKNLLRVGANYFVLASFQKGLCVHEHKEDVTRVTFLIKLKHKCIQSP